MDNLHLISFLIEAVFTIIGSLAAIIIRGLLSDVAKLKEENTQIRIDLADRIHVEKWEAFTEKVFAKFDEFKDLLHTKEDKK